MNQALYAYMNNKRKMKKKKISCHAKVLNLFHTGLGLLDLGSSSQQVELFPQSMVCTGRRPGSTGC
jgi:hypothetical protein